MSHPKIERNEKRILFSLENFSLPHTSSEPEKFHGVRRKFTLMNNSMFADDSTSDARRNEQMQVTVVTVSPARERAGSPPAGVVERRYATVGWGLQGALSVNSVAEPSSEFFSILA
jgi:hypothetical protein